MKIYVSGPYTKGDPCENTHRAIAAGNRLLDAGLIPFVPHLSHFWHTMTPRAYDDWMRIDLAFLPACDVLLRLPGESSGATTEEKEAKRIGMPVRYSVEEVVQYCSDVARRLVPGPHECRTDIVRRLGAVVDERC